VPLNGYRAKNHPQQVAANGGGRAEVDDRATTPEAFGALQARFGFTIDVAAQTHNAKLPRFYSPEQDGLAQSWAGERVWCNPPFSNIEPWIMKAWAETAAELVVIIVPANRTELGWWQRWIEPYRDRRKSGLRVEFLPGRMRFIANGKTAVGPNERPPFGCCLLVFDSRRRAQLVREQIPLDL
jgi:phage N-6-adenine-methyltransferase